MVISSVGSFPVQSGGSLINFPVPSDVVKVSFKSVELLKSMLHTC